MKANQTLRAPKTNSWLITVNIDKNMQGDDLLEFVKPIMLLYNCAGRYYEITA